MGIKTSAAAAAEQIVCRTNLRCDPCGAAAVMAVAAAVNVTVIAVLMRLCYQ